MNSFFSSARRTRLPSRSPTWFADMQCFTQKAVSGELNRVRFSESEYGPFLHAHRPLAADARRLQRPPITPHEICPHLRIVHNGRPPLRRTPCYGGILSLLSAADLRSLQESPDG